nr:immunoglobulin heavy chain junction region [Mus musculus]
CARLGGLLYFDYW